MNSFGAKHTVLVASGEKLAWLVAGGTTTATAGAVYVVLLIVLFGVWLELVSLVLSSQHQL